MAQRTKMGRVAFVRLVVLAVSACGAVAMSGCAAGSRPVSEVVAPALPVRAGKAEVALKRAESAQPAEQVQPTEPKNEWIEVAASLEPWRRSRVGAEESGRVTSVGCESGDVVKDAAVLMTLDDSLQKLAVARDEASVEVARLISDERAADLEQAGTEMSRLTDALPDANVSAEEFQAGQAGITRARSQVGQARAELVIAESALRESRRRLERLSVKAPFAGVVVERRVQMGEWAKVGDTIAEVVDLGSLEVRLWIPEELIAGIRPNETRVRVTIPTAGLSAELVVLGVVPEREPISNKFLARARLENKDGLILPGMAVVCVVRAVNSKLAPTEPPVQPRMDSRKPE